MNYNDEILENKAFNIFKQVLFDIVLAICIMLAIALILVYGFRFRPYEVLSDSMYPVFKTGDMVIVKAQDDYEVGDIIKYNLGSAAVTHRLIAVKEHNGVKYYITHGDNVQSPNTENGSTPVDWELDAAFFEDKEYTDIVVNGTKQYPNIDVLEISDIEGRVVTSIANYGTYVNFIADHKLLVIAMIIAIWCVCATVQNEIEMRKTRRIWIA